MKILKYLWQLPQHLLALLLLFIYKKKIVSVKEYKYTKVYKLHVMWGISLGKYILIGENYPEKTIHHEYGHSIQSLYIGPLYLLIIGLPSISMNILSRIGILDVRNYYNRWPESWADKLGNVKR